MLRLLYNVNWITFLIDILLLYKKLKFISLKEPTLNHACLRVKLILTHHHHYSYHLENECWGPSGDDDSDYGSVVDVVN